MKVLLLISTAFLAACASGEEESDMNQAAPHYASYAADGFTFNTPEPEREDPRPLFFYHKYCNLSDMPGHFSPTSYGCDDLNR